jgi:hypothetical protein
MHPRTQAENNSATMTMPTVVRMIAATCLLSTRCTLSRR